MLQYSLPPESLSAMELTAASSGQTLRQLAGEAAASTAAGAPADARHAAAAAALARSSRSTPQAAAAAATAPATAGPAVAGEDAGTAARQQEQQTQQQQQQQQQTQQQFVKGQAVLYRQRDGSMVPAVVVSVDRSVQPPSIGVDIQLGDGGSSSGGGGYRETEAERLEPLPQPQEGGLGGEELTAAAAAAVEGLGHRDSETEAKEEAVRLLKE